MQFSHLLKDFISLILTISTIPIPRPEEMNHTGKNQYCNDYSNPPPGRGLQQQFEIFLFVHAGFCHHLTIPVALSAGLLVLTRRFLVPASIQKSDCAMRMSQSLQFVHQSHVSFTITCSFKWYRNESNTGRSRCDILLNQNNWPHLADDRFAITDVRRDDGVESIDRLTLR